MTSPDASFQLDSATTLPIRVENGCGLSGQGACSWRASPHISSSGLGYRSASMLLQATSHDSRGVKMLGAVPAKPITVAPQLR
jgi:hypothetical protein